MNKKKATEKAEVKVKQGAEKKEKEKVEKEVEELVRKLEKKLGLPEKFSLNILKHGDDWSFVIKLHAFLEAVLTQLVVKALGKDELEDIIGELEMNKKIEYTKSLSLLSKEARRFIRKLSNIRNIFVHKIENTFVDLRKYVNSLNPDQLKNFIEATSYGVKKQIKIDGDIINQDVFIKDIPRIVMWVCAYRVIQEITFQIEIESIKRDLEKVNTKVVEAYFPHKKKDSS